MSWRKPWDDGQSGAHKPTQEGYFDAQYKDIRINAVPKMSEHTFCGMRFVVSEWAPNGCIVVQGPFETAVYYPDKGWEYYPLTSSQKTTK